MAPTIANTDRFVGTYVNKTDPRCSRSISRLSDSWVKLEGMVGSVANAGVCNGTTDDITWGPYYGNVKGDSLVMDLTKAGGPKEYTGTFDSTDKKITWSSGHSWSMMF